MIVQSLIFPKIDFQPDSSLYYNNVYNESCLIFEYGLKIAKNSILSLGTYYNAFFVKPWIDKTDVRKFFYEIDIKGHCVISLCHRDITGNERVVSQEEICSDGKKNLDINIKDDDTGCFFIKINTIDDVVISGGYLYTEYNVVNKINLGIVITHFNRKDYVVPAINRIKNELLSDELFEKIVKLHVVDNSQNIGLDSSFHKNVKIINNKNLGGSGGFTRGLMEVKDNGDFTHCLFMDDDASCEIDSIKRTIAFLMYCNDDVAISGSLFRELETTRLVEKGAIFNGMAKPLCHNLSMSNDYDLMLASESKAKPNYGAWWFFAFPINRVKYFPFPFFVRGDDIQFSLLNEFKIETLMGIGCFGDDFGLKSNPMTRYLDTRHTLVQNIAVENLSYRNVIQNTSKFFFGALLGFNYDSARCASLAIKDFCSGIEFWSKNIDMSSVRENISKNYNTEKMEDISLEQFDILFFPNCGESRLRRFIRICSIQGFLLPRFLLRKKIVIQPKHSSVELKAVFRASKIMHYYEPYKKGYIASFNRYRFFKELCFYILQIIKLRWKYKNLEKEYKLGLKAYTSEDFWKEIYK